MMEKQIIELLDNNVRVVLPDLGAFIVKQRKPLKIIFNEFLKYNDGLLIEYTAKSENISKEEATKKIADFVSGVKDKVSGGNTVTLVGLGELKKDATGNIAFELNEKASVAQTETTKAKEEVKDTKAKSKETKKPEKVVESKVEEKKEVSETPPPPPPPPVSSPPPPIKEKPVQEAPRKPVTANTSYTSNRYVKADEEGKNRTWLWITVVILTILIVVLTIYITKPKAGIEEDIAVVDEQPVEETMPDIVNEEDVNEEVFTEEIEVQKPISTSKRYYIIAGCFKVQGNADKYVNALQKKGYPALKLGYFNGYDVVAFNSFSSRSEALAELEKIRGDFEPEAWIKKY